MTSSLQTAHAENLDIFTYLLHLDTLIM